MLTKKNKLSEIVDPRVAEEVEEGDVYTVAKLAVECLRLNGKKRPTMKEVFMELEGLRKTRTRLQKHEEPQMLFSRDEIPLTRCASEIIQESMVDGIVFAIENEFLSI